MKKILSILFCLALTLCLVCVNASGSSSNPDYKDEKCINSNTEIVSTDIMNVATLYQSTFSTYNGGNISANKLDTHPTYWVEPNMAVTQSDIRVVAYSGGSLYNWQGKQPSEIAKLYEKEHPGWIVLAGINGDFFHISENSEPLGGFMQEGDFYKPYNQLGNSNASLGFFKDGTYIYGPFEATSNEHVEVLKNGNYEDFGEIKVVDKQPSEAGISLLTRFNLTVTPYVVIDVNQDLPYDLSAYKVVKVMYDVERFDRGTKKVFLKGTIIDISQNQATYKIDDTEKCSYLVAKDGSLDNLQLGDYVRCQCQLTGKWEDVYNISEAYNEILKDYQVINYLDTDGKTVLINNVNKEYVNCAKNRTVMGFKEDGTPIIMVVEKHSYGSSYEECAAQLKAIGCKDGYLFDGGGSSCIFVRTPAGTFQPMNKQEDGWERSDANAVLLVMRDPGFNVTTTDVTRSSVKVVFDIYNNDYFAALKNVKVSVGDKTVDYVAGGVVINGLDEETEYQIKVTYDIDGFADSTKTVKGGNSGTFTTKAFEYPAPGLSISKASKYSMTAVKDMSKETASWIQDVVVHVGDTTFNMGKAETFDCTELLDDTEYTVYFEYVIVDPESGKRYPAQTEPIKVSTLSYELPEVTEFGYILSDNVVKVTYQYKDKDRKVTEAYILVNDTKYPVTVKTGTLKLDDLDLVNTDYVIQLVLVYEGGVIESIDWEIKKTGPTDPNPPVGPAENTDPAPTKKKKCGKKSLELIVSLISITTVFSFVLRKRR